MVRSRTIRTLAALLAAMTVGTGVLIWMETAPARPTVPVPLRAVRGDEVADVLATVRQTEVPLQPVKWRNVVVHDDGREGPAVLDGAHFLIGSPDRLGDGVVRATRRWRRQQDGGHIYVPGYSYNENSVGIVLLRDSGRAGPTPGQLAALIELVRALQMACPIPRDHVYLHSELGKTGCPGESFPAEALRSRLISATR